MDTDPDSNNTIGDFRFGLETGEQHARFVESLYREIEPLREMGTLPAGTTYWDIADVILDTISGYAGIAPIPATDLAILINDALEQIS